MRTNGLRDDVLQFAITPFSTRSSKKAMSSARSFKTAVNTFSTWLRSEGRRFVPNQRKRLQVQSSRTQPSDGWCWSFCAEGQGRSVDLGQSHAIGFNVQLTRHREEGFLPKKSLRSLAPSGVLGSSSYRVSSIRGTFPLRLRSRMRSGSVC